MIFSSVYQAVQCLQDSYDLQMKDKEVPIDHAGLVWACVYKHAKDYLGGHLLPALIE
jgi:hypothetical protein